MIISMTIQIIHMCKCTHDYLRLCQTVFKLFTYTHENRSVRMLIIHMCISVFTHDYLHLIL
jgi:hypothetical protein